MTLEQSIYACVSQRIDLSTYTFDCMVSNDNLHIFLLITKINVSMAHLLTANTSIVGAGLLQNHRSLTALFCNILEHMHLSINTHKHAHTHPQEQ